MRFFWRKQFHFPTVLFMWKMFHFQTLLNSTISENLRIYKEVKIITRYGTEGRFIDHCKRIFICILYVSPGLCSGPISSFAQEPGLALATEKLLGER